jgi:uncharacterized protein (TIGR03118 family)
MGRISIRWIFAGTVIALALSLTASQARAADTVYVQTNLVSDIPGLAQTLDPNLKNPWGVSFSATSPFWAADAGSNLSTLYSGSGSTVSATVVSVPGGPTGTVQNSTAADFNLKSNGRKASFIFATLDGSIYSWNTGTVAEQSVKVLNASFTGLALATNSSGNFLYASNIMGGGGISVFDKNFAPVTLAGSFIDPGVPAVNPSNPFNLSGYVPYNIQTINGQLYVEYANFKTGGGAVSVFDTNGNFIKELVPPGEPHLNIPWGVVIAPAGFGTFANDVLVGNFGDGKINAYDPTTGAYVGTLSTFSGPIVNSGLWSLSVRTGGTFNTNAVYVFAGINNQADGLFAVIAPSSSTTLATTNSSTLPAGKLGGVYSQTLAATGGTAPYSNWSVTAGSLPPGVTLNSANGVLSGTPTSIGGTYTFSISFTDTAGAKGTGFFQLTIQTPAVTTPLARVGSLAEMAVGGGWKSTLTLINLSASATVTGQVNFYNDTGSASILPLYFTQYSTSNIASSVPFTVGPNDSIVIESRSSSSLNIIAWADILATGPLSGYMSAENVASGGLDSLGSLPLDTRLSTSLLLPYDNTNGYQTGLALANQSAAAQTIAVTLLDQNGAQLAASPITLPAYGHMSFFLASQFSKSAGQLGIIQFQGTAGVTGLAVRMSPAGSFTFIPIIR